MKAIARLTALAVCTLAAVLASGCERPPQKTEQTGYRGLGMVQVQNPRLENALAAENAVPKPPDAAGAGGPKASQIYKNVKLLGDLSEEQFTRLMISMTEWVAPEKGCAFCHNEQDLALDDVYAKVVARRMLQMTKDINANFKTHVGETGVTCYTCHRGNPVPKNIWYHSPDNSREAGMLGFRGGQNAPATEVGLTSLPGNPFSAFLSDKQDIRVVAPAPLPTGPGKTIQSTEDTYGLMMHMSSGLGVNCTFCHNTRSFASWEESSPQRTTAWHAIRMLRALNGTYLEPLKSSLPADRLGALGDAPKAFCSSCHQGRPKPLDGVQMLKDYLELNAVPTPAGAAAR